MLKDFHGALRGDKVSPFHLNPQSAVSEDHLRMLNRLWAYESLAVELAPEKDGIAPLRTAMMDFEQDWMELEKQRGISVTTSVMQFIYKDHVEMQNMKGNLQEKTGRYF